MTEPSITVTESTVIGGVASGLEATINHPLWIIKTRLQSGQPFTLKPSVLYCGTLLDATSSIPITAFQVGTNQYLQQALYPNIPELSNNQKIPIAFAASALSSPFICATEMVMTWQGQIMSWEGKQMPSFIRASRFLLDRWGAHCLLTGLTATTLKESTTAAFLLGVTPALKAKIHPFCSNDGMASLSASIVTGVSATVLTQGLDTAKTIQQSASPSLLFGFKAALQKIKKENGIYGYFKGTIPNSIRAISSMFILSYSIEKMETELKNYKKIEKTRSRNNK